MIAAPQISIVISAHDHGQLDKSLNALARQTVDPSLFEVVIVDPEHTPGTESTVEQALATTAASLKARYIRIPRSGRAAAQNRGVAESAADWLLFLADDFVPAERMVEAHLRAHRDHPGDHIVGIGPAVFPPDIAINPVMRWLEDSGHLFGISFTRDGGSVPDTFFYGANASVRKDFLLGAGPFDEEFPYHAWDDYEMGLRLAQRGMKSIAVPDAVVYHYHSISLTERCRSIRQGGASAAIFDSKYPPPQPWHKECARHPLAIGLSAWGALVKFALFRRPAERERYYERVLTRAFVAGYREALSLRGVRRSK